MRDAEDRIGHHLRALTTHLRQLGRSFEIVAVDEGSRDNSLALLSLLLREIPELTVIPDAEAGAGYARGVRIVRGRALLLVEPSPALDNGAAWAPLSWALSRLDEGKDAVVIHHRYVVCRRTRAWRACDPLRARGEAFRAAFLRRARAMRLVVEERGAEASAVRPAGSPPRATLPGTGLIASVRDRIGRRVAVTPAAGVIAAAVTDPTPAKPLLAEPLRKA